MRRRLGVVLTLAGVGLAVLVLVPARSSIDGSPAALVLVVPVAVGVAIGGFPVAPVGVITGFLAFDFFFIPPYDTLRVATAEQWVSLAAYTAVALIVGGVVAQVQRARAEAEERESEVLLLYELARTVSDSDGLEAALRAVAQLARLRLNLATVAILLSEAEAGLGASAPAEVRRPGLDPTTAPGARSGLRVVAIEGEPLIERDVQRLVAVLPLDELTEVAGAPGLVAAPLPTSAGPAGVLAVTGTALGPGRRRLLSLFATQAGTAVERARLANETARSVALAEVDRLRSSLMGSVSHDLRTPLASIKASVSDLADPAVHFDEADRELLLTTIEEETDRLTRLVSNLLDMGRIEAGALVLHTVATPIDELVEAVLGRFTNRLSGQVRLALHDGLPFLDIDYVMIEQVLSNLLENVVRHCPAGTNVEIAAVPIGEWAEVRVTDDGPGIAPGDQDRIFQLFFRARGTGAGGTGMGLAICQGIVQAHGGTMWVERAASGGSVFVFRLPLSAAGPPQSEPDMTEVDVHS